MDDEQKMAEIRAKAKELEDLIKQHVPRFNEQSWALAKLKKAVFYADVGMKTPEWMR